MTQRDWRALVVRGKELAAADRHGTRFALGDCALDAEPLGTDQTRSGGLERLREYASEIGIAFETLRGYRAVAAAWPDGARAPSVDWSVHRALMGYADRRKLIRSRKWTPEAL